MILTKLMDMTEIRLFTAVRRAKIYKTFRTYNKSLVKPTKPITPEGDDNGWSAGADGAIWMCEKSAMSISQGEWSDVIRIKGDAGSAGPLIYPAGIFSLDKSYTRTSLTAPYVAHNSLYYYLSKTGTFTGINPADDYAANGVNATWRPYDNFQAAFFEIVMAEFARLGKAVFFNDYMMSQYGVTPSGADTNEYQNFAAGTFIPNILLNFLTGAGHLSAGNFSWDQYGRTYRKSKEIIVWRSIADEFGTLETGHNVNLKKGTYFDLGSWTKAIINLPDPALHQGLELELRGPIATTRIPRDWPTFRSNGFAMMGWSTTTSDYVTCSRVISYITGSARAYIISQKVNNVWTWVADNNFTIVS